MARTAAQKREERRPRRVLRFVRRAFVLGVLVLGVPAPVSFIAGASCEEWEAREHGEEAHPLEELLAREVDVHDVPYLPAAFRGYTLTAESVLLAPDADYVTLAHELAHTAQITDDGVVRYSLRYASEWYEGLWNGCSIADARRGVSYEQAAEAVADEAEHRYLDVELWQAWRGDVTLPEYVLALEAHRAAGSPVAGTPQASAQALEARDTEAWDTGTRDTEARDTGTRDTGGSSSTGEITAQAESQDAEERGVEEQGAEGQGAEGQGAEPRPDQGVDERRVGGW